MCVYHCGGGQGEKYARVAYPEVTVIHDEKVEKSKESRIEMISEAKIRVNAKYFIMLTVSPSSLSGSFPPFEN